MAASRVEPERRVVAEIVAVLAGLGVSGFAGGEPGPRERREVHTDETSGRIDDHTGIPHDLGELLAIIGSFLALPLVAPEAPDRAGLLGEPPHRRPPPPDAAGDAQRVELAGLGHRGEKILIVGHRGNGERATELGARLVRAAAGEGLESDAAAGAVGLVVAPRSA